MTNDTGALSGHCTFLIDGECYTFPLPAFTRTTILNWGGGEPGDFHQERWAQAEIDQWAAYEAQRVSEARRWAWVTKIPGWVKYPRLIENRDEDNELLTPARRVVWVSLRPILTVRHIREPRTNGSHYVARNFVGMAVFGHDAEGVVFVDNVVRGPFDVAAGY